MTQPEQKRRERQPAQSPSKLKAGVLLGVGCITSPCCTPLLVPLALTLIAGTPLAVWLSANLGLLYGGLTLISIASLLLGLRWLRRKSPAGGNAPLVHASDVSVSSESN